MPRYRLDRLCTSSRWNRCGLIGNDANDSDDSSSNSDSDISSVSSNHSSGLGSPTNSVSNQSSRSNSDASDGEGDRRSNSDHSIISAENSDNDDDHNVTANNSERSNDSDASLSSVHSRQSNNSSRSGSSIHIDSDNNTSQSAQSFDSDSSSYRSEGSRSFRGPVRFLSSEPHQDSDSADEDLNFQNTLSPTAVQERSDNSEDENEGQNSGADSENNFFGLLFNTFRSPSPLPFILPSESDSDSETVQFPNCLQTGATGNMTGPRLAPSSSASTRASSISYECSVCLENLDAPASIDEPAGADLGNNENDVQQVQVDGIIGASRGNTRRRSSRGRGSSARVLSQRLAVRAVSPTDVVATFCGHLYHQVCLEKWFAEQGKRTCPSCRLSVPSTKMIRLYPNISVDTGTKNRYVNPESQNVPGPSGTNNINVINSVPTAGTSASSSSTVQTPVNVEDGNTRNAGGGGSCAKPECQDLKVIHNTLITDFNDLQERYNDIRENEELKEAQIRSLEEDNARQCNEIQRLKRQVEEITASAAPPPPANKRRRH